ncbi:MAG: hybrid sensor histidine kinase/response regulator [Candidatus Competibacter sp.]|nr:hybrid sensor histidine kinase/response regulator [Candidatus Competibacter sp.]MDG4582869.1 hybrid sensor histidine kinase/response regulator [Candidatus Competibacter sp.]
MSDFSMLELFRVEAENQVAAINQGLLDLERAPRDPALLEALMRAAHSIKGAARIVKLPVAVTLAHAMEDCFTAAQKGLPLHAGHFDLLLRGADRIARLARVNEDELTGWSESQAADFDALAAAIRAAMAAPPPTAEASAAPPPTAEASAAPPVAESPAAEAARFPPSSAHGEAGARDAVAPIAPPCSAEESGTMPAAPPAKPAVDEKVLRIDAGRLDRLMGLAAEALVESRGLAPFARDLLRLKRRNNEQARQLEVLREHLQARGVDERTLDLLRKIRRQIADNYDGIVHQLERLDGFDRRSSHLARQLYREATASRMRPFADGVAGFPRLARDLARDLGKQVRLDIAGAGVQVDRDILEKLQAPLNHLLRNAIDHGIESPVERQAAGKPPVATIRLEARHQAGMLSISVVDDGRGIDPEALRRVVAQRGLVAADAAAGLSDAELFEFLFLPGFTLRDRVTEISGRGVGLDVVANIVQQVRGTVKTFSERGRGARFQLQLPLSLSVVRGLIVRISGEPYVFPLARIDRVLVLAPGDIHIVEGREYCMLDGAAVGLIAAHQVLELPAPTASADFRVVVIGDRAGRFGVVVDQFLLESTLVVQPLDPRLGKLRDVAAATLLEDGSPALILDVDDLIRSIDRLTAVGRPDKMRQATDGAARRPKRILVVDDSLTVREVERKLLENRGYQVDVAVDGMDGWNTVRTGDYQLIISDVDMPRLNGIELVTLIKRDPVLRSLPAMIVSYKEREEDRQRGLEAGADYYLAKSSFQDDTLLEAVEALIGEA